MARTPLYIATDDDYDPHELEGGDEPQLDHPDWVYDADNGDDGAYDDDDYGEGVTVISHAEPFEPSTDLSDVHYLDPLALVNAWEGALSDLKGMHPERFLPPTEPPRSLAQKQAKAPFWYGPPPSAASTSKNPPPAPSAASFAFSQSLPSPVSTRAVSESSVFQAEQPKKRKRLTGSQKKARKQAKLEAAALNGSGRHEGEDGEEEEVQGKVQMETNGEVPLNIPTHLIPTTASLPPPAGPSQPPPPSLPHPELSSHPSASLTPAAAPPPPPRPSSFSFLVPPAGRLPQTPSGFPQPPPITPLTGEEPPLEAESPEQLLEAALWSWYTAGYQTALYHAAVGVAKFKHEAPGKEGGK
ncbi:hypothetical protein JCM8547_005620 [Rhodosporidiobolus lusitaniae]